MHKGDGNRALPNRRRHPLDIAAPDIADRMVLSRAISEGLPKIQETTCRGDHKTPNSLPPWDLTAGQLIGADNALALARLRMDIERELRRIALETQIDLSLRPVGIKSLARELVSKEVLPVTLMEPLEEVAKICNLAIHGGKVADDVAAAVVRVGGQLLEQLRLLPKQPQQAIGDLQDVECPALVIVHEIIEDCAKSAIFRLCSSCRAGAKGYTRSEYTGLESGNFLSIPSMLQHEDLRVHELQPGQLGADLPEAFGSCTIVGDLRRAYRFLLDEILPSDAIDHRGTG
jgi:hypothetical protein